MNTTTKTPIVLIHGLWMTPKSWDTWADRFRAAGHQVIVPGWPGIDDRTVEDIRSNPEALKGIGLKQIADNYERIIRELPEKPIIIGHSFGGVITQMLADRGLGVAYVGVAPGQTAGVTDAPALDAVDRHADPREPVRQERRQAAVEAPLPLHVRQRPAPQRVRQALGGVRRELLQPGLLRGRALGAQREGRRHPRRLRPHRPRTAAHHHRRDRPRRAAGHRRGDREEVPEDGQPRDRRLQDVPGSHPPPRQPGRLGGDRRLRPRVGDHPRGGRAATEAAK